MLLARHGEPDAMRALDIVSRVGHAYIRHGDCDAQKSVGIDGVEGSIVHD